MKRHLLLVLALIVGSFLFQSFQCASPDVNNAKMFLQQREYLKAKEKIESELAKNPNNTEALLIYAEVKVGLNDYIGAAKIISDNFSKFVKKEQKEKAQVFRNLLWTNGYNAGLGYYNEYKNSGTQLMLDSAIMMYDVGLLLRPDISILYMQKGYCLELKKDNEGALKLYESFMPNFDKDVQFSKETTIQLNTNFNEIEKKFGKSKKRIIDTIRDPQNKDVILSFRNSDLYPSLNGKEVYLFSEQEFEKENLIKGWRINPPSDYREGDKFYWMPIRIEIPMILADNYKNNNKYSEAIKIVKEVIAIDPKNEIATKTLPLLYKASGNENMAYEEIENQIKANPGNKIYYAQYGNLLSQDNKFDKAIEQYNKALEIDPEYDEVLFQVAANYKNKAATAQAQLTDKTKLTDDIRTNLEKAVVYFEKALQTTKFKDNFIVLNELYNTYQALSNKAKKDEVYETLENIEFSIPKDQREDYFKNMMKIAGERGNQEKASEFSEKWQKAEEARKNKK